MKIISYDFDGVLHTDVFSFLGLMNLPYRYAHRLKALLYYPSLKNIYKPGQLAKKANINIINQIKKECKQYDIYIITQRSSSNRQIIKDFLKIVGIDKCIKKIIFTTGLSRSKSAILNKYNIIRHYEDSLIVINEIIRNSPNVEIIRVYPFHNGVFKKYESKKSFPTLHDILLIFFSLCLVFVIIYFSKI